MNELQWLVGCRFQNLAKREHDWAFQFDHRVCVVAACLWRLIESGRICVTDRDDGQWFGRPVPVDAADTVNSRLAGITVRRVALREVVLDLVIEFDSGFLLEFIPDSSGYESWDVTRPDERLIAIGGGRLEIFREGSPHVAP